MKVNTGLNQFLGALLLKPANFFRKAYWKVFSPSTFGVRLLYLRNNKVALVRHSYIDQWYLPGGQLKKGETIEEALKREIKEELDIDILKKPMILGIYFNSKENKKDHIIVFATEDLRNNDNKIVIKNIEIKEAKFFNLGDLPKDISPGTKRRIGEFLESKSSKRYLREW